MQASLKRNIGLLYTLQMANLALPLVNVPFLARALGPAGYGELAFAVALSGYFGAVVDFGFNVTGTRAAAALRADPQQLGALLGGVTAIKLALLLVSTLLLLTAMP